MSAGRGARGVRSKIHPTCCQIKQARADFRIVGYLSQPHALLCATAVFLVRRCGHTATSNSFEWERERISPPADPMRSVAGARKDELPCKQLFKSPTRDCDF